MTSRVGEKPSTKLSQSFLAAGFELGRLKTGTPPRLKRDSIDFSQCIIQPGDDVPRPFSFSTSGIDRKQVPCYLTATNELTAKVISDNLHLSPLYSGVIDGVGPRYCPSIEDKVVKFPDKNSHNIFLEPEGLDTDWIYPNGISTSLAEEVQLTELSLYGNSPLVRWSKKRPVYTRYNTNSGNDRLKVYPYPSNDGNIDQVIVSYIKKPEKLLI